MTKKNFAKSFAAWSLMAESRLPIRCADAQTSHSAMPAFFKTVVRLSYGNCGPAPTDPQLPQIRANVRSCYRGDAPPGAAADPAGARESLAP